MYRDDNLVLQQLQFLVTKFVFQELHLEKTRIFFPDVFQRFEGSLIHPQLRKFQFLSDQISLKFHPFLTRCVKTYFPNLEELEIQPQNASGNGTIPRLTVFVSLITL